MSVLKRPSKPVQMIDVVVSNVDKASKYNPQFKGCMMLIQDSLREQVRKHKVRGSYKGKSYSSFIVDQNEIWEIYDSVANPTEQLRQSVRDIIDNCNNLIIPEPEPIRVPASEPRRPGAVVQYSLDRWMEAEA